MKQRILSIVLNAILLSGVYAQTGIKYTVSGYLKDGQTTESLMGASVYSQPARSGTTTNRYGFYSITLPDGEASLHYSFVGYAPVIVSFSLRQDTVINVSLTGSLHLEEVIVTADRIAPLQEQTQMSMIRVPVEQVKSLTAFLGEADVLKTLQLLPGVQSGSEGRSGLYVRGGGPDQNLFLLDGVPVYNVSHLFGFFSVFNADAINNVELYKGGFPARYGGRTSSVVDITLKEGNMQQFHGEGSVGIISSKLTLEGPIWKNRTSFIVSGRRTFADLIARPVMARTDFGYQMNYYFYDLTAKINHQFSERDRIFLSTYLGDDVYSQVHKERYTDDYGEWGELRSERNYLYRSNLKWGNVTTAFRWNHLFGAKLFSNTILTYSRYRYLSAKESRADLLHINRYANPPDTVELKKYNVMEYLSKVSDWGGRMAFDYHPSPMHYIRFGGSATLHDYTPGAASTVRETELTHSGAVKIHGAEYSAYIEDDIMLTDKLKMNIGLHWSGFNVEGRYYQSLQPRLSTRYLLTDKLSVKTAYSRMTQYVHLLANSSIGLQMDLWVPSTDAIRPQTSHQVAIGLAQNFKNDYEISLEGYYKTMDRVMEFREGVTFLDPSETWQDKVLQGKGRSYGAEFFAQKKTGKFTGWVGYTLSWTDRQFDELNNGNRFYYKYDRRHDVSLALIKRFGSKLEMSATWVFGTGTRTTVPVAIYQMVNPMEFPQIPAIGKSRYFVADDEYVEYDMRNNYRMNAYHRLDLSVSLIKKKKWGERRWVFSLYNAYCRSNPFYIDIRLDQKSTSYISDDGTVTIGDAYKKCRFVQYSLFPIIPSISYQFKF